MSRGSNAHKQYVTRCPVFRLVHSPRRPASVFTWKISTRDPCITIVGSGLIGLVRLSYNRKVDFGCVQLRCQVFCKASKPGSCNQGLLLLRFFKALEHTQNFSFPPSTSSYPLLFRLLIRLFKTTTSFQQLYLHVTTLHNQISTFTATSLQHLK